MSRSAAQVLEFDQLKGIVGGYTTCAPGRRAIEGLALQQDVAALDAEFVLVAEAASYLRAGSEPGFGSFADPEQWLARLTVPAAVLSIAEFLDASSLMEIASSLRQAFKADAAKYPQLATRAAALGDFRHLATAIRRAILPNGEISDEASPQLRRIRTGIAQGRATIRRSLEGILRARGEQKRGRRRLRHAAQRPLRDSGARVERRGVPGVVHGASATGQTVFVEPLEAIDLNNRLVQLSEEELVEISRILAELTERLRADRGPLMRRPRRLQIWILCLRARDLLARLIA